MVALGLNEFNYFNYLIDAPANFAHTRIELGDRKRNRLTSRPYLYCMHERFKNFFSILSIFTIPLCLPHFLLSPFYILVINIITIISVNAIITMNYINDNIIKL